MKTLSHPFLVHIQMLTPNPTHHLPSQPIFSPCIYVPACFTYLCAYAPLCFTCPCTYTIHFYALYCRFLYTLHAFVCVNASRLVIYTVFLKHACNTSVLLLVPIFRPWFLCLCFSVLSSLLCCKRTNIFRTKEKHVLKI